MTEVHFRLDSITRITLVKRKLGEYYWAPSRPEKRTFFGLIVSEKALPAGWSFCEDDRYELKDILKYSWYSFDESNNKIYIKPQVEIRLLEQGEIIHRFNSDEEAIAWIDDVIAQTEHKFVVIGR